MAASTLSSTTNGAMTSPIPTYKVKKLSVADAVYALPIRVAQSSGLIEGRQTHVLSQHFADRILVIVTQVGKMGALTQLTTHKRPTLPRMYDDDFLNDSQVEAPQTNKIGSDTNDATTSQPLFGTTPTGQETLYDFYKQQISALVQSEVSKSEDTSFESKPIIVGLSLALPPGKDDTEDNDDQDDFLEVADTERSRFEAVLKLVRQARTW